MFRLVLECNVIAYAFALHLSSLGLLNPAVRSSVGSFFAASFSTEVLLSLWDQGPRTYFSNAFNWSDLLLAAALVFNACVQTYGPVADVLRLATGVLRISTVLEVLLQSPPVLQRLGGVAFFVAMSAELKAYGIQTVVGMFAVFLALLAIRRVSGPERASAVYRALEPAKTFLVKWATLFFVPALIKLPLLQPPPGSVLLRLGLVEVLGFLFTLGSTVAIAGLFPEVPQEPGPQDAAPRAVASSERPYRKRLLGAYGICMLGSILALRTGWVLAAGTVFMLCATLLGFVGGMLAPSNMRRLAHPMFVCIAVTWAAAAFWAALAGPSGPDFRGVLASYCAWPGAGALLTGMLGPALLALGVLLFERRRMLLAELMPIFVTSVASSLATLFGTAVLARALGLSGGIATATLTRSISTPFAADLTGLLGASSTYAIAMVVLTGFLGVVFAPPLFGLLRLRSPRTRGLAMGASAHGLGTVALAETDQDAFPYSALGFLLVGSATSVLLQLPPVRSALLRILLA